MRKYVGCRLVDYPLQVWFIGPPAFGEPLLFFLRAADVHADPTLHTLAPYDAVNGDSRRRMITARSSPRACSSSSTPKPPIPAIETSKNIRSGLRSSILSRTSSPLAAESIS